MAMFPSKPNLCTASSYVQNGVMRSAQNLSLAQIVEAMEEVAKADAAIKGLGTSFTAMDTIERLVFELGNTLSPKRA